MSPLVSFGNRSNVFALDCPGLVASRAPIFALVPCFCINPRLFVFLLDVYIVIISIIIIRKCQVSLVRFITKIKIRDDTSGAFVSR